jgi:hypothetical protein
MSLGDVGLFVGGVAALIPVLAPIIRNWKDNGPRGWAYCGIWAAVVAFAAAGAIILYGLAASDPVMGSAAVGRYRLLTIIIGLIAVSTGTWGAVTARPRDTAEANETLVLGISGILGGMIAIAAMAVIVLPFTRRIPREAGRYRTNATRIRPARQP